jgi:hypothetical protein
VGGGTSRAAVGAGGDSEVGATQDRGRESAAVWSALRMLGPITS